MTLLRLCSIRKSYGRGRGEVTVLRGASLTVHRGSLVAIYGDRSSGKTTLLRIAAGFDPPDAGRVAFEGARAGDSADRATGGIGWVVRGGPRSDLPTVRDHVALPLYRALGPRQARNRALAALAALGVDACADARWSDLADVERTLCATAQALVREPALLIADAPTAGLGVADRDLVVRVLRSLAEDHGLGVLIAVPDVSSTLLCHDTLALSGGRLLSAAVRPRGADVVPLLPRRSA